MVKQNKCEFEPSNSKTIKTKDFVLSISESGSFILMSVDKGDVLIQETDFAVFLDKMCVAIGQGEYMSKVYNSKELFKKFLNKDLEGLEAEE